MPDSSIPETKDFLVQQQQLEGKSVYVLHRVPGTDPHLLRTREDGVAQAVAFARRQRVRAWLTDDGREFELLEDFRTVRRQVS